MVFVVVIRVPPTFNLTSCSPVFVRPTSAALSRNSVERQSFFLLAERPCPLWCDECGDKVRSAGTIAGGVWLEVISGVESAFGL